MGKGINVDIVIGVAKGQAGPQRMMIEKVANSILHCNAKNAKVHKPPLTFDEAMAETKRVLAVELHMNVDHQVVR